MDNTEEPREFRWRWWDWIGTVFFAVLIGAILLKEGNWFGALFTPLIYPFVRMMAIGQSHADHASRERRHKKAAQLEAEKQFGSGDEKL